VLVTEVVCPSCGCHSVVPCRIALVLVVVIALVCPVVFEFATCRRWFVVLVVVTLEVYLLSFLLVVVSVVVELLVVILMVPPYVAFDFY